MESKFISLTSGIIKSVAIASFISIGLVSCSTDEYVSTKSLVTDVTKEESLLSGLSEKIFNLSDLYLMKSINSIYYVKSAASTLNSPSVTVNVSDTLTYPRILTIDFGTTGDTINQLVYKGKIYISLSAPLWKKGHVRKVTLSDFSINSNIIKGNKVVTYNGLNSSGNKYWTIVATDTVIRTNKSDTLTWYSERIREHIDNSSTLFNLLDDKYSLTGWSKGVSANKKAYSVVIDSSNPLIFYSNYQFFTKGIFTMTYSNSTGKMDFGNGLKDNLATVKVNNGSWTDIYLEE